MLARLEHLYWLVLCCAWLVLCCTICAADSSRDSATYGLLFRHLFPTYGERRISLSGGLRTALKRQTKLRTANGFGKRGDPGLSVGGGINKREEAKIKKLQMGSLRTAIGFGKRNAGYIGTPQTDSELLLKFGPPPKESFPVAWNEEETADNDSDALSRIIRKVQDMKGNMYDEASPQTDEPSEGLYHYSRFFLV